ncbi:hypothetical protein UG55_1006250 [Frankia sp. EI5c]|uniref:hypothetical protein n=1 Tax=Frankia sp. EI5c TaxID=683316 RepID=UPI0007C24A11|nr:hypothetical protein [Frankia sp. EI5c]OAA28275.1 hypothetical protein UG55_1006250 [Frankia sp. EI5c]
MLTALLVLLPVVPGAHAGAGLAARAAAATAPGTAPAAQVPAATVSRTANFLTDPSGRVVLPRGVTVPAGTVPTADDLRRWLEYGFTAVRLEIPMTAGGRFPPHGAQPPAGDQEQGGLEQAGALVRELTDRGFLVVIGIVPGAAGYPPSTSDLVAGLRRLASRFSATGGLVGFEVPTSNALDELSAGLRSGDAHHTLWAAQPAPFAPAARVAANAGAGYITGWADGSAATAGALADAADAFNLGWFYDAPATGRPSTGIGAGQVRALATPPAQIVRPYPAAVAGTPRSYGSDAAGVFRLAYQPARAAGGAFPAGTATAIVLPGWSFSSGYQVRVTGGQVTSAPGAGVLCVVAAAGASQVTVEVAPASGAAPVAPARAGAGNCPAATSAPGAGSSAPVAEEPGARDGGERAAGEADSESPSPLLLLVLPLLGAALAAAVLGPVFRRLRRR